MKVVQAALCIAVSLPLGSAFAPVARPRAFSTRLAMADIVTGPGGKAATSAEEDLALTLRIIMDHEERSTTVSKEQFISQMVESESAADEEVDVSIPYDAAAKLAYEASDKSVDFEAFEAQYLADARETARIKAPLNIPYDAAAGVAYKASDRSIPFAEFKAQYLADAKETARIKAPLNIPYDAAAGVAYKASDRSTPFAEFKAQYLADTIAMVTAKAEAKKPKKEPEPEPVAEPTPEPETVDVSIPYNAAARLAYEASDKSVDFDAFEAQYLADARETARIKAPLNIPYDAAAGVAYKASDRSIPFAEFKAKYLADTIAMVTAKATSE
eukprot:CAMPEP_0178953430 /NCGR_PEP_ID=MMETSP0789-20121207/8413_1 /TAXON_ID=3005 /ORGANISM="Rhizosolenia setigera, Strain CCMP 1694" /LENGTH=328 /DNA_ID=CAMNT_0020634685 /DNA_START=72 /DNA_END=1058 /DNA_ORIENTATION=+